MRVSVTCKSKESKDRLKLGSQSIDLFLLHHI